MARPVHDIGGIPACGEIRRPTGAPVRGGGIAQPAVRAAMNHHDRQLAAGGCWMTLLDVHRVRFRADVVPVPGIELVCYCFLRGFVKGMSRFG